MTTTTIETYTFTYDGPAGEPDFYTVKAKEVAPDLFNVYVTMPGGLRANGAFGTVAQAEVYIVGDRHRRTTGHLPGSGHCMGCTL